eukprot:GHVH01004266.1.p1 GENE.GHVH01004266.1~~GHVH01004266.1.p1  ORF type:complete len:536 (-),score=96.22 GHVH01004266.1:71-1678(-)
MATKVSSTSTRNDGSKMHRDEKSQDIRKENAQAVQVVCEVLRTSLGPRGMDKLIVDPHKGQSLISNDGATIMKEMSIAHPVSRMLVDLSSAQDVAAGDGTTSVVLLAGALLDFGMKLYEMGIHPGLIAKHFSWCTKNVCPSILQGMSIPISMTNRQEVIDAAITSLSSKVVAADSHVLAPIAVDAMASIAKPTDSDVDLDKIRVVTKLGGNVEDTELINGLVFTNSNTLRGAGGPITVKDAKIGLAQFQLGPPKSDMEQSVVVKTYEAMDRLLREERKATAKQVKAIAATGCNVLLVQKSILRSAVSELACDYLAKAKIMLIRDVEREDIDFVARTIKATPIASLDEFDTSSLGTAQLVVDEPCEAGGRITRLTGVPGTKTTTILCRSSNQMLLDETERSMHDALCVVRSLYKSNFLLPGGGAAEMELACQLLAKSKEFSGEQQICVREFSKALELLPYTLAENCGLSAMEVVTALRNEHSKGNKHVGIDVRKGKVGDLVSEKVVQPLTVTLSAITLATETVCSILKIDDVLMSK